MPTRLLPLWALALLAGPACFRYARLITRDQFPPIRWGREQIEQGPEWLADLVACHWCASGWVAIALVGLLYVAPAVAEPLIVVGAVWGAGAWIADQEPDDDPPDPAPVPFRSERESEVTAQAVEAARFPNLAARLEASPPPDATTRPYHGGLTAPPESEVATMVNLRPTTWADR